MKLPSNIYGPSITVIAMAILLLGDARDSGQEYIGFGILVIGVVLMAYLYRRAILEGRPEESDDDEEEGSLSSRDSENHEVQQ